MNISDGNAEVASSLAASTSSRSLLDLIFTDDFRQRRRITMALMSAFIYGVCVLVLAYAVSQEVVDPVPATFLGTCCAVAAIVFVVVVRSGLNLRFKQPSLAFPQALVAQTLIVGAYVVSGPAHASNLILFSVVMSFGMFDIGVRNVRILTTYTICLLSAAMMWCVQTDPATYPPKLELISFVVTSAVLATTSLLSTHLAKMRNRLRVQQSELQAALLHINKIATVDELTGLPNRRHVLTLIADAIARSAPGGPALTVAIADLDYFKKVNDTYGHRVGDQALACFANQARKHLRSTDVVARWGGEEFLLLLSCVPPDDPNLGIERLRRALSSVVISGDAPLLRLAFSAGMTRHINGETIDDMIERADRALYLAKGTGRNCTISQ